MNMVDINLMLPDVMGAKGLLGVPPEIVADAVRKTAIDFCQQSTIWEYTDHFMSQTNVQDYPLDIPFDARVASMRWVTVGGTSLSANAPAPMPVLWGSNNPASINGRYGYTFAMEGREFVWVNPAPQDCTTTIEFCCALKPKQSACQIPDFLMEDYNDTLASGAAYRMFAMPKQDWTNNALAMLNYKEYMRGVARARLIKAQGTTQSAVRMSGSYF